MKFETLGLTDSLLRAVRVSGYTTPTPIQSKAVPAILDGRDVMAAAQTGTGKTAGFTLPLLQLLGTGQATQPGRPRALVLTPTRELAAQVLESIQTYGNNEKLHAGVVFGGVNINPQLRLLKRGVDILVATPGRLLDLYQQKAVKFDAIEILVLDEADRMLDMGFIHDIRRILGMLPAQRQNLMFSATFSPEIRKLAKTICRNPIEIDVAPRNSTVEAISQELYRVEKQDKAALLSRLLGSSAEQTLVFSRTKHGANKLVKHLRKDNISAEAIHGNKSQAQRTRALGDFKSNRVQVLVATDIAARGIDIDQLSTVINFDLPHVPEDYVHRIGRTGRAGASGQAISLVSSEETRQLRAIERLIKQTINNRADSDLPPMRQQADRNPVGTATRHQAAASTSPGESRGNGQQDRRPADNRTGNNGNRRRQNQQRRQNPRAESRQGGDGRSAAESETRSGPASRRQRSRPARDARAQSADHRRSTTDHQGEAAAPSQHAHAAGDATVKPASRRGWRAITSRFGAAR